MHIRSIQIFKQIHYTRQLQTFLQISTYIYNCWSKCKLCIRFLKFHYPPQSLFVMVHLMSLNFSNFKKAGFKIIYNKKSCLQILLSPYFLHGLISFLHDIMWHIKNACLLNNAMPINIF